MFIDTDCLVYEIETNCIYEDFNLKKVMFDVSESRNNSRFSKKKKKVISKMKDESKDALIFGLVGWKSKIFSCIKKDSKEEKSQKELIEILFKIWRMKNTKTRFLRRNEWGTTRKQYTNLRNINLTQCIYHVVMIENKYLMMELKLYYTVIKILINYFH